MTLKGEKAKEIARLYISRGAMTRAEFLAEHRIKEHELRAMRKSLEDLARRCAGGDRPDCPILDDLAIGVEHVSLRCVKEKG